MKKDSKIDFFFNGALVWVPSTLQLLVNTDFFLLLTIPTTELPGAHPTLPTHKMKATRTE